MTLPPKDFQKIVKLIRRDFPQYNLKPGTTFIWSPMVKTITYDPSLSNAIFLLLHELAHGELNHKSYRFDIELIRYEVAAWEHAKQLARNYGLEINEELVQDNLDTYRVWLHQRSICPHCQEIGLQSKKNIYNCINCRYSWRVNSARQCKLRRSRLQDLGQTAQQ